MLQALSKIRLLKKESYSEFDESGTVIRIFKRTWEIIMKRAFKILKILIKFCVTIEARVVIFVILQKKNIKILKAFFIVSRFYVCIHIASIYNKF